MGVYIPNLDEKKFYEICKEHNLDFIATPAADVRPVVRGVWVKNGWSIRCSICGYDMPFSTRNFCPKCGALMEES